MLGGAGQTATTAATVAEPALANDGNPFSAIEQQIGAATIPKRFATPLFACATSSDLRRSGDSGRCTQQCGFRINGTLVPL